MRNSEEQQHSLIEEDSIDLVALFVQLWNARKFILKGVASSFLLGVVIALVSPVKFSASTSFTPQISDKNSKSGSLSAVAALAGVNLSNTANSAEISPMLYEKIAKSIPFRIELLDTQITTSSGQQMSLQAYYLDNKNSLITFLKLVKKYTIGLPRLLFSLNEEETTNDLPFIYLDEEAFSLVESLDDKFKVTVNDKEGFINITSLDKDPLVTTQITNFVTQRLQKLVIEKRIEKAKNELEYTQTQFKKKNKEFEEIQDRLAAFKDRNQNISTASFLSQLQRLESEYTIALSVVRELATQVEQTKLQVNKDTPIFTVIEPVTIPSIRSEPKRSLIVLIWSFLGLIVTCAYVLVKTSLLNFFHQIKDTSEDQ